MLYLAAGIANAVAMIILGIALWFYIRDIWNED